MRKFYLLLPFFLLFSAFSFGQESNRINDGSPGFYDSLKGKTLPLFTKSATIGTKSAMAADEALVYVDYALANDGVVDGLTALGYTVTIASSWNDFSTQLASGDFGIAVAFAQDNGAFGNGFDVAAAENYISSGGKMVFATWNSGDEPIANLFEAHLTGNSNRNTVSITDTDIASGITNPFSLANPGWGIYSLGLEPLGGGEMLATFENGEAAMVLGNSGQTIMLGYLSDTPPAAERQAIFENVVKKLAGLCNEDIVVDNDEGQCGAVVTYDAPTADGAVVTQIDDSGFVSGDEFPVGETTQEFEFDYGGGDKDTCSFTVTVNDVEFPVIDCPANIVIENDPGEGGAVVWYSATQNFTGEFAPENWTLETNGGNGDVDLSEAPGKITLWGSDGDSGSEIFTEYKITIPADGSMSFTWNYLTLDEDGPSFDPFGYSVNGNYMQLSYDEGGIMQEDSETIALNAGDEFSFFVWTEDDVAGAGSSAVIDFVFSRGGVEVTDNCPGTDWAANYESGSFFPIGETEVVLTATDASGNTSTCSFAVTVNDTEGAEVVANPIDVYLDETGGYTLAPEDLEMMADGTTDNYTPFEELELSAYPHIFNCGQVGEPIHTRLTVEDNEGNISRAWTVVTVYDTIAPVFAPVADVEIVLEPGVAETAIEYPAIEVTDNCMPTPELIEGLGPDGIFPAGTTIEKWAVEDVGGNTDTLFFAVTVITTNDLPAIDAIDDVTADEDASPVTVPLTGISYGNDIEEQTVTITAENDNAALISSIVVGYISGSTGSLEIELLPDASGSATITVTVEDSEGGMVTETFMLTVNPVNDAPYLVTAIDDQMVNASYVLKVEVSSELGVLFDDIDGDELTISAMLENGDPLPAWAEMVDDTLVFSPMIEDMGCIDVVVKATDTEGAFATDTFRLCVEGYPVSAEDISAEAFSVNLYPNPARNNVNLEIKSSGYGPVDVSVYTITGKEVLRRNFSNSSVVTFSMAEQVSGVYFVKLQKDGQLAVKKLVLESK